MAAVRYRFRAELRARWKSVVTLALLAVNVIAAFPARRAADTRPAVVLRSE